MIYTHLHIQYFMYRRLLESLSHLLSSILLTLRLIGELRVSGAQPFPWRQTMSTHNIAQ